MWKYVVCMEFYPILPFLVLFNVSFNFLLSMVNQFLLITKLKRTVIHVQSYLIRLPKSSDEDEISLE